MVALKGQPYIERKGAPNMRAFDSSAEGFGAWWRTWSSYPGTVDAARRGDVLGVAEAMRNRGGEGKYGYWGTPNDPNTASAYAYANDVWYVSQRNKVGGAPLLKPAKPTAASSSASSEGGGGGLLALLAAAVVGVVVMLRTLPRRK